MYHFYTQKLIFLFLSMISIYVVLTLVNQQSDTDSNWFQPNEISIHDKLVKVNHHEAIMAKSIIPITSSNNQLEKIVGHESILKEIDSILHLCVTYGNDKNNQIF